MKCLSEIYAILDANGAPGCSKIFIKTVFRKKGALKLSPDNLKSGSDSGPLLKLGLIEQDSFNNVELSEKARKLIGYKI